MQQLTRLRQCPKRYLAVPSDGSNPMQHTTMVPHNRALTTFQYPQTGRTLSNVKLPHTCPPVKRTSCPLRRADPYATPSHTPGPTVSCFFRTPQTLPILCSTSHLT